jgi:hypothetical protein
LCAAIALLAWLTIAPRTPDLAAAAYRLDLFKHVGLAVYDEHWYAGHDLPGYSLLFPPLAWLLSLRAVGVLSVLVSTLCFERLAVARFGAAGRWASLAFALAAVGDVWIGRLAFALGLAFALASVLALAGNGGGVSRWRTAAAVVLAAMSGAASPVAGLLLALAALSESLWRRSPRSLLLLAVPAAFVALALAALFPEGGFEPYPTISFVATALVVLAFACALPREGGLLRFGAGVYLLACIFFLFVSTPVGSNIERYGVLLAGPLLICAVGRPGAAVSASARALAAVAFCGWAVWAAWGPVRETLAVAGSPATNGAFYAPVERFLAAHTHGPVRLEVPLTRTHWETAELAPRVSLARGWEKQLDERYNSVLLTAPLLPGAYDAWLHQEAVSYVALPDVELDPSSAREGRLIESERPFLRKVYASRHWQIYEVRAPTPIASGPGRLTSLGHDSFALSVARPGSFLVRVRYTPYWTITSGAGCVQRGAGGWTRVDAQQPGRLLVHASFSLGRAFGASRSCAASSG